MLHATSILKQLLKYMKLVYTREIYLLRPSLQCDLQYELQYEYSFYYFKRKKFMSISKFISIQKNPSFKKCFLNSQITQKNADCILCNNLSLLYTSAVLLTSLHCYTELTTKEIESRHKIERLTLVKHLLFLISFLWLSWFIMKIVFI